MRISLVRAAAATRARHSASFLVPLVLWTAAGSRAANADANPSDLTREFLSRAPAGWAKLEEASFRLDGAIVVTRTPFGGSKPNKVPDPWTSEFLFNTRQRVLFRSGGLDGEPRVVVGINPEYSFVLRRKEGSRLDLHYLGQDAKATMGELDDRLFLYTHTPWKLLGEPLASFIKAPGFRLDGVSKSAGEGGSRLVTVSFQYTPPPGEKTANRGGKLVLMPERCWAMKSARLRATFGFIEKDLEYGDAADGVPTLRSLVVRRLSSDRAEGVEVKCDVKRWDHKDVPAERFTLSAFGMSEPASGPAEGRGAGLPAYMFLAMGVLTAGAAAYLRRGGERRAA